SVDRADLPRVDLVDRRGVGAGRGGWPALGTGFGGAEVAWHHGNMGSRVSARIAAIAPSATLAVDAKAKALKAAGEPVIGFGAGEADFPTPAPTGEAAAGRGGG